MSTKYVPVVAFPDQSASFVHGFEAGKIWQLMKTEELSEIDNTTHSDNREVIRRMATAAGWDVEFDDSGVTGWDFLRMHKSANAERPQ